MNTLTIAGKSMPTLSLGKQFEGMLTEGGALIRFSKYAEANGVITKKDDPKFDRDAVKALRRKFDAVRPEYYRAAGTANALLTADPSWEVRSVKVSKGGNSITVRHNRVSASEGALVAQLRSTIAELQAKLNAPTA